MLTKSEYSRGGLDIPISAIEIGICSLSDSIFEGCWHRLCSFGFVCHILLVVNCIYIGCRTTVMYWFGDSFMTVKVLETLAHHVYRSLPFTY